MLKHLVRRSASVCLAIGRRILPKLLADPRLAGAAAVLQTGQESFQAKVTAYENAVESVRSATAARDQALRGMADRLREFALNVLSTVRNNHGADSYLRYFPVGYGTAIRERPEQIPEITRVVLGKLAEETDPWLVALRDRLNSTHEAFLAAQNLCVNEVGGRNDAFSYLVAEKRLWVQALVASRLRAKEACMGDEAYVGVIFLPAAVPQRQTAAESATDSGIANTPAKVEATVGGAASAGTATTTGLAVPVGGVAPSPALALAAVPA